MARAGMFGIALIVLSSPARAPAQCEPVWSSLAGHDGYGGGSLAVHDEDGPGPLPPALFVGNGLDDVRLVARWDGWEASLVGEGLYESFYGLEHLESIPEPIGMLDAGLYVGGDLKMIDSSPVNGIARWDGDRWHDVGGGLTAEHFVLVNTMAIFDEDGEGPLPPVLFVGGRFQFAGGVSARALARWDGERWSEVGGSLATAVAGTYPNVNALAVYDDGRGPALYVAGSFAFAGGKECWNIARWDGREWEPVGPGFNATVESLQVFDEDSAGPKRPALFAGGQFNRVIGGAVGSLLRIARWDGSEWTPVGGWRSDGVVRAMTVWDEDGPGPKPKSLYAGGIFNRLPDLTPVRGLARWDGEKWHDVGGGVGGFGPGSGVNVLAAFDEDGPGPNPGGLYVGGAFYYAGEVYSKHIARWGCPLPPAPPCYADCDGSGDLTFFDFLCFQNLFAALDPGADCDGDGAHTFFDFLCF